MLQLCVFFEDFRYERALLERITEGATMRKRQKLLLLFYIYLVLFLGFIYVPYNQHYPNGVSKFVGHHFRFRLLEISPWDRKIWGHITIDANLIIAEILVITLVASAIFVMLRREE